ncbi:MAG: hypothetical protein C0425_11555 [Chlorobiaceae bacterium]|nr:hypothetical protein [Chlorobiaceae bacterium]MBA4310950.1 hypothetical protein [Chlorobiaceae bacterium]
MKKKTSIVSQQFFTDFVTLLVGEKSIEKIYDEFLVRSIDVTKSDAIFLLIESDNKNFNIYNHAAENESAALIKFQKNLLLSLPFILKWIEINKKAFDSIKHKNEIANFHLNKMFSHFFISPTFFDQQRMTLVFCGSKNSEYSENDLEFIEQFGKSLSLAEKLFRTFELNKNLEQSLLQKQKLETIGKLTSGIAHDFSNLLSSIFGSVNILKKKIAGNSDALRLLENIEQCSIRAKELTTNLLSFGKPTPKQKEFIKLNLLLGEISKIISQTFPGNIKFKSEIQENLPEVLGNSTQIYQVILNLCVNARDAMSDGGALIINATPIEINEEDRLSNFLPLGKFIRISVIDSGKGIENDNLIKIFDPYFSTKEKSGSGLGLYISYGIIKAHKGHIEVFSEVGRGTKFVVYIPQYEAVNVSKSKQEEKIIILADDEVMLQDLLAELLESVNYQVIKVQSGEEVIKLMTEEIRGDLIIIDFNMPGMNGIECLKKLQELKINLPVILSSGSMNIGSRYDLSKVRIDAIINKPYDFDSMLETVKRLT